MTAAARRLIVVELNEVPWRVLDDWAASRPSSAVAGLLAASSQFVTHAPDQGHLSPWITWPTVHRGVDNTQHGIAHFGQDLHEVDERFPPYWVLARHAGKHVGVFAALHSHPLPADVDEYDFWLPDPFAPTPEAHPPSLSTFQAFNLAMARESARNVSSSIDWGSAGRFLAAAPSLGVRPATVATVVRQLADERRRPWTRTRRRSLQSVLGFDLFVGLVRKHQPDLSVLFTNHVASAMHRYWAARYPHDFDPARYSFSDDWQRRYAGEIDVAMGYADHLLLQLRRVVDSHPDLVLVVASSMGQASAQGTPVGTILLLRDVDRFIAAAGIDDVERRPAMDPMVSVRVDAGSVDRFEAFVGSITVDGEPLRFSRDATGFFSIEFGQADTTIGEIRVGDRRVEPHELGLEIVVVEDEAGSSGYHVPEGSLFVYDPNVAVSTAERAVVETTEIAPMLLNALGVAPADHHVTPAHPLVG